ncbi:hypothetical protein [Tunturiibacter gelidoferens]|uniref:Uncharacterized protein n=1 Tax=Tunturiibacter gelidiferens TaxID=3069689 RepID=A0A9X0QAV0_9BACT|nr:hypothetical protein [Edaphobacter lichenicola]MBB5326794.1 hypothetical protein [Edaphobacter lichenicola]
MRLADGASAEEGGNSGFSRVALSKVPEVAIGFWIIKIAATTLGETAGDALSMGLGLGYLTSTIIFFGLFLVLVVAQIRAKRFIPISIGAWLLDDARWNNDGGLCGPLTGDWVSGRNVDLIWAGDRVAGGLEAGVGYCVGEQYCDAKG